MYLNIWGGEKVKMVLIFDWFFFLDRRGVVVFVGSWWCGWIIGRRVFCIYLLFFLCFWRGWGLFWGLLVVSIIWFKILVLILVIRENNSRDCICLLKIICDRNCDVLLLIIFFLNFCKKNMCKWILCKMN